MATIHAPSPRPTRPLLAFKSFRMAAALAALVSWLPAQAAGDAAAAYVRLQREPESARLAAARELAAAPGARALNLLRQELQNAKTVALQVALLEGLAAHPRPELAGIVAGVLRPSAPDAELGKAVGAALVAMGEPGIEPLRELITSFAIGRSNHPQRPGTHGNLIQALGKAESPRARAAAATLAMQGHPADRQRILATLAGASGEHGVRRARLEALSAPNAPLVLEGLRQLAAHDDPELVAHMQAVASRATGPLEAPLLAGLAPIAAEKLRPELHGVFFAAAAATDPTLGGALRRHADKVRADAELGRYALSRAATAKTLGERVLIARLVASVAAAEATTLLVELAQGKDAVVVETALAALETRRDPAAIPGLRRLLRSPGAERQRAAMLALDATLRGESAWLAELRAMVDDPELRVLALDLLAERGDLETLPAAHALLADPDWHVRAAVYDFCRRVRVAASIPLLIDRLGAETGRMRQDVVDVLASLTGQTLRNERQWRDYWQDHAAGFVVPPAERTRSRRRQADADSSTRTYYSLPVVSEAVMFVVDRSGSMAAKIGTGGSTRLEEAKRQIARVLGSTPAGYRVGVVAFDTAVEALQEGLVELDDRSRKDLIARVQALRIAGATNVHDALAAAFAVPEVDTIYLLTDGAPSAGPITDPAALRTAVARWNRTRRIRIHTISVGTDSPLMRWLAEDSGGATVSVR